MAMGAKVSIDQIQIVVGIESHFVVRYIPSLLKEMVEIPVLGVGSADAGGVVDVGGHTGGAATAYVRSFEASICSCHIAALGRLIVAVCSKTTLAENCDRLSMQAETERHYVQWLH